MNYTTTQELDRVALAKLARAIKKANGEEKSYPAEVRDQHGNVVGIMHKSGNITWK